MITPDYETRISSFYAIFREITSKNATFIRFSNNEKQIYGNIADLFMSVCSSIEYSTKYIDNIEVITKRLEQLVQKSLLEELVQNNCSFIECFITAPYRYKKAPIIPVENMIVFIDWWKNLSDEHKIIVLNNLWERFDTIKRIVKDDLPF